MPKTFVKMVRHAASLGADASGVPMQGFYHNGYFLYRGNLAGRLVSMLVSPLGYVKLT